MSFYALVKSRYSCRMFSNRPVEDEKIEKLLELGRLAPTALNKQPFKLIDVKSEKAVAAVREATRFHYEAMRFIVVAGDKSQSWQRRFDGHNTVYEDTAIVGCYIMLGLLELDLMTTWVAGFDPAKLSAGLDIPEHLVPVAIFPIGYPADDAKPSPMNAERKPLDELVIRR
jgi:nitroreductase